MYLALEKSSIAGLHHENVPISSIGIKLLCVIHTESNGSDHSVHEYNKFTFRLSYLNFALNKDGMCGVDIPHGEKKKIKHISPKART